MGSGTARDMYTGGDEYVTFEVYLTEMAARTDIGIVVNARVRLREQRAELNCRRPGAPTCQRPGEKCSPEVLARNARYQREHLRGTLQRAISAHHRAAHGKRQELRRNA